MESDFLSAVRPRLFGVGEFFFNRIKQVSCFNCAKQHSVMTYQKEGPACGKIPCGPTSSEADCEYPLDYKSLFVTETAFLNGMGGNIK